jgi:gamma-glutamyl-gamma-aminobutyrate hydrolase PuuD
MKAFVLPGAFYGSCVALMAEAGFQRATDVDEADVIVFIGGEDINPELYHEKKHPTTYFTESRDFAELYYYQKALKARKPMFGICRGAQFLHAMNGGKLWQNVNNHGGRNHVIYDIEGDTYVEATSIHHQMLRFNNDMDLVAVCDEQIATSFESGDGEHLTVSKSDDGSYDGVELEIEAGAYNATQCFFVQGHPEIGNPEYRAWAMNRLYDYMMSWAVDCPADEDSDDAEQAA